MTTETPARLISDMRGIRYGEFIHALQLASIMLDRKSLSEIAIHDPAAFDQLVAIAREKLPQPQTAAAKA